jgi:hypothetical protein
MAIARLAFSSSGTAIESLSWNLSCIKGIDRPTRPRIAEVDDMRRAVRNGLRWLQDRLLRKAQTALNAGSSPSEWQNRVRISGALSPSSVLID